MEEPTSNFVRGSSILGSRRKLLKQTLVASEVEERRTPTSPPGGGSQEYLLEIIYDKHDDAERKRAMYIISKYNDQNIIKARRPTGSVLLIEARNFEDLKKLAYDLTAKLGKDKIRLYKINEVNLSIDEISYKIIININENFRNNKDEFWGALRYIMSKHGGVLLPFTDINERTYIVKKRGVSSTVNVKLSGSKATLSIEGQGQLEKFIKKLTEELEVLGRLENGREV